MILVFRDGCWFLLRRKTGQYQFLCKGSAAEAMDRFKSLRQIGGIFI